MIGEKCWCLRCGAEWISRAVGRPVQCPRCKTLMWEEERKGLVSELGRDAKGPGDLTDAVGEESRQPAVVEVVSGGAGQKSSLKKGSGRVKAVDVLREGSRRIRAERPDIDEEVDWGA